MTYFLPMIRFKNFCNLISMNDLKFLAIKSSPTITLYFLPWGLHDPWWRRVRRSWFRPTSSSGKMGPKALTKVKAHMRTSSNHAFPLKPSSSLASGSPSLPGSFPPLIHVLKTLMPVAVYSMGTLLKTGNDPCGFLESNNFGMLWLPLICCGEW